MTNKWILYFVSMLFYLMSSLGALGQSKPTTGINQITAAAVQTGALTCGARIEQVTNYLGVTLDTRAVIRSPQGAPDSSGISVAMTVLSGGVEGLAIMDFLPKSNGCMASYVVTSNFEEGCDIVRTKFVPEQADGIGLGQKTTAFNGSGSVGLYFLDATDGCTVIKAEIVQ